MKTTDIYHVASYLLKAACCDRTKWY